MRTTKKKKHKKVSTIRKPKPPKGLRIGNRVWSSMGHAAGQSGIPRHVLQWIKCSHTPGALAFRGSRVHEALLKPGVEAYQLRFYAHAENIEVSMIAANLRWNKTLRENGYDA
jgi:hypothetical protein